MKRVTLIVAAFLLTGIGSAQDSNQRWEIISFERGYNMRDRPHLMASGFFTGNSYNVDPQLDGSAKKRSGLTADKIGFVGADTSVNLLAHLERNIGNRSVGSILAVAGDKWFARPTGGSSEGTYSELTPPVGVRTFANDDLQAALYGNRLIVTGDLSEAASFDGDSLYRLFLPPETNTSTGSADTSTGGSLAASTSYYYVYTYLNQYGEESYATDTLSATTSTTGKTIALTGLKPYPYTLTGGKDTLQVAGLNIYRGTNAADLFYLATIEPFATSYTDDGSLTTDKTSAAPPPAWVLPSVKYATEFQDFLFMVGPNAAHRTRFIDAGWMTSYADDDLIYVSPDARLHHLCKYVEHAVPVSAFNDIGYGYFIFTRSAQDFVERGVAVGDYFSAKYNFYTLTETLHPHFFGRVVRVMNEDSVLIKTITSVPDCSIVYASIGNNIIRYDDEVMAISSDSAQIAGEIRWLVGKRGLFGTSVAAHSAGSIFLVRDSYLDESLIYTFIDNPLQQYNYDGTYDEPIDVAEGAGGSITGLARVTGGLLTCKKRMTYGLTGNSYDTFNLFTIRDDIGNVAPKALATHGGGAILLDEQQGLQWLSLSSGQAIADVLGSVIRDSAATNYLSQAAGRVYEGDYYLSVVKNATTKACDVYKVDLDRTTITRYTGWSPHVWGAWPGDTDEREYLYFGDWRKGNVYKIDEDATSDVDSAGTATDIACQVITPAYMWPNPTGMTKFHEAYLTFDSNDSVRVTPVFTDPKGLEYRDTPYVLSPSDGDTTASGHVRTERINLHGYSGYACRLEIWATSTATNRSRSRFRVYPGAMRMERLAIAR